MKISYSITVCNELEEIQRLINVIQKFKRSNDVITVLYDSEHGDSRIEEFLRAKSVNDNTLIWFKDQFKRDFAEWKNKLISASPADYVFNIDADEMISQELIEQLPTILEQNPQVDLFWIGRINTVDGITSEHIMKWRWNVDKYNRINYPDPQSRIIKKQPGVYWSGKVHETVIGANVVSQLPFEEPYVLYHHKNIQKQEKQNSLYNEI